MSTTTQFDETAAEQPDKADDVLRDASLFRFATAGSVDDGKSTLVGRLLHDSKSILADQLESLTRTSAERGFGGADSEQIDLALLTDGLRAEREQGITIDVAYRYFATANRSFILADCPGHVQYTRNTVTGASTADAVVVLVDARHGIREQTRRHLSVLALLRVPNVVLAVNKIDLVDFSADVFAEISADAHSVARRLDLPNLTVIPVSALEGDNVVTPSARTPFYDGPTLLDVLEQLPTTDDLERDLEEFRFPVQSVIRPQGALAPGLDPDDFRDYRSYAGQVVSGNVRVGDSLRVLPSEASSVVVGIDQAPRPGHDSSLAIAAAPQSVVLRLSDDLDISRGGVLCAIKGAPTPSSELEGAVAWLSEKTLTPGSKVLVKHGTRTVKATVTQIVSKLDLATFDDIPAQQLELNEIGAVSLRLSEPLPLEEYASQRRTGAFLVASARDGNTLGAGIVHRTIAARLHDEL